MGIRTSKVVENNSDTLYYSYPNKPVLVYSFGRDDTLCFIPTGYPGKYYDKESELYYDGDVSMDTKNNIILAHGDGEIYSEGFIYLFKGRFSNGYME